MSRKWNTFSAAHHGNTLETYTRPIVESTDPYAVVVSAGLNDYRVASADSIDEAMVIADEVLRDSTIADPGIRIYLRSGGWCHQVHYVGSGPWPTHVECERTVALECMRDVHRAVVRGWL